ncbi:MAG: TIR domain-containing protein, partial [Cyanobium sp.]
MTSTSGRRFAVAFSYAGEDRPRVAPLAEALAARLGRDRVLYDRFHEAEFTRIGLNVYLPRLYRDESELIVVVLSPDYPRKQWCGLEFRWIRELFFSAASERIMLLSLGQPGDLSELGILSGDSYLEISQRPAAEVVERICERLTLQGVTVPRELPPQPGGELAAEEERTPSRWRRWFSGPHRRRNLTLLGAAGGLSLALALPLAWRLSSGWLAQAQLAPTSPEPQARLGFLHDLRGELPQAKAAYERARDLEPSTTTAARGYRIGLAAVLAQLPGGQHQALEAFQADPN